MTRESALRLARRGTIVTIVSLVAFAGLYVRAIYFTPTERTQGLAQKIFYVHAPVAIWALVAFAVTGLLSLLYLWMKDRKLDALAASSAEVGLFFSVAMLTTGPIWGKTVWGTWWDWDARLTSTLFLFLLFIGYMVLRGALTNPEVRVNYSAVLGILALALVPFIHMTVYWFRTLHPEPVVLKPSRPSMPGEMLMTFLLGIGVFTIMYVGFMMQRYALTGLHEVREEEQALGLS